jgi:hypothetical protein
MVAGLRIAKSCAGDTLIVGDSMLVHQQLLDEVRLKTPHLLPFLMQARDLYATVASSTVIAHMFRDQGNDADAVVKTALKNGRGEGDSSIFPESPVLQRNAKPCSVPVPIDLEANVEVPVLTSMSDFIALRRLKVRSSCPAALIPLFANLVKQKLRETVLESTIELRSQKLRQLRRVSCYQTLMHSAISIQRSRMKPSCSNFKQSLSNPSYLWQILEYFLPRHHSAFLKSLLKYGNSIGARAYASMDGARIY